jgi:thiol:disulfide interchange protein DsbA
MNRRDFCGCVAASGAVLAATSWTSSAFAQGGPVEGVQYVRLQQPAAVAGGGKIDLIEFFSYACPHCNAFEPTLEPWVKKLPADVAFRRVPVPFLANHENFQRLYFSLEALGAVDAMHAKVFHAVHVEHQYLDKPADIYALMAKNGIDSAKFQSVFTSFGVQAKAGQATQLVQAYRVDGVPAFGVQGRYFASGGGGTGGPGMLPVAEFLLQKVRTSKA